MFQYLQRIYGNRKAIKSNPYEYVKIVTNYNELEFMSTIPSMSIKTSEPTSTLPTASLTSAERTRKFSILLKHRLYNTSSETIYVSWKYVNILFRLTILCITKICSLKLLYRFQFDSKN